MAGPKNPRVQYNCSFCGKEQHQVHRLIAGPGGVYVCNECVALCQEILSEEERSQPPGSSEKGAGWRAFAQRAPEGERLRQEALSTTRAVASLVASRDYGVAVTEGETLLGLVRTLRDRETSGAGGPGDGE